MSKIKAMLSNPLPKKRVSEIKYAQDFLNLKKKIEKILKEEKQNDN